MLELTHDIDALPSLFVACVAAHAVTVLLMKRSILTEKVARRGHHIVREYMVNPMHTMRVRDVMERDVVTVPASLPVATLFRQLADTDPVISRHHAWLLVDETNCLVGIISRSDLVRALDQEDMETDTLLEAGTSDLVVTYADELLERAARKMLENDVGRLPVVRRDDPRQIVGYLGRTGLMKAWMSVIRDEGEREPGWLTGRLRTLGERVRRS